MERYAAWITLPVLCVTIVGCTTILDPDKFRQNLAEYSVEPGNKAMVINTQSAQIYWVWSRDTPQAAIDSAKANCVAAATAPGDCVPVAINDKQVYDPIPGALAAQKQQDDLNAALTSFAQSLNTYRR